MKVTAIQNIKNYSVTANQTTKQVRVTVKPAEKKETVITVAQLGKRGFRGKSNYEIAVDNGFVGTEEEWLSSLVANFYDTELIVTANDQTQFNIFSNPLRSNLFINDLIYFKDKSYDVINMAGNWKLVWKNEFLLKTTDLLIFRKY